MDTPKAIEYFKNLENMEAKAFLRMPRWTEGPKYVSPRDTNNPYALAENSLSPQKNILNKTLNSVTLFTSQGIDEVSMINSLMITKREAHQS